MITEFERMVAANEYAAKMKKELEVLIASGRLNGANIEKAHCKLERIADWICSTPLEEFPDCLLTDSAVFGSWYKDMPSKVKSSGIS